MADQTTQEAEYPMTVELVLTEPVYFPFTFALHDPVSGARHTRTDMVGIPPGTTLKARGRFVV
jgi:hypothetical protein